jgi:hypothetical protein
MVRKVVPQSRSEELTLRTSKGGLALSLAMVSTYVTAKTQSSKGQGELRRENRQVGA